jgi:hypothetical protein
MSGGPHRLPNGGLIDRQRPLSFTFDGHRYQGFHGDTLASALLANGVRLVGRSFKYHRPRGIYTAGSEEPNALVRLREGGRGEPNIRATQVELYDGLGGTVQITLRVAFKFTGATGTTEIVGITVMIGGRLFVRQGDFHAADRIDGIFVLFNRYHHLKLLLQDATAWKLSGLYPYLKLPVTGRPRFVNRAGDISPLVCQE